MSQGQKKIWSYLVGVRMSRLVRERKGMQRPMKIEDLPGASLTLVSVIPTEEKQVYKTAGKSDEENANSDSETQSIGSKDDELAQHVVSYNKDLLPAGWKSEQKNISQASTRG